MGDGCPGVKVELGRVVAVVVVALMVWMQLLSGGRGGCRVCALVGCAGVCVDGAAALADDCDGSRGPLQKRMHVGMPHLTASARSKQ